MLIFLFHIQHMKDHREEIGENTEVKCKLCPKSYPKLSNLIRHARTHEENATHECIHCGKRMGMGDDLIDHLLCHQGFKPFHCEVEGCEKSFIKYHKLRLHQKSHEDNIEKPHACNQCEKTFSDVEYLKRHLLRHSGRKDHACSLCPSRFTFKSGLNSHMTTHSMNSKKFSCDKCDAKFTKMQSLRTHQKIHLDDVSWKVIFSKYLLQFLFSCVHRKSTSVKYAACDLLPAVKWEDTNEYIAAKNLTFVHIATRPIVRAMI